MSGRRHPPHTEHAPLLPVRRDRVEPIPRCRGVVILLQHRSRLGGQSRPRLARTDIAGALERIVLALQGPEPLAQFVVLLLRRLVGGALQVDVI
jgi:hypothetical protein